SADAHAIHSDEHVRAVPDRRDRRAFDGPPAVAAEHYRLHAFATDHTACRRRAFNGRRITNLAPPEPSSTQISPPWSRTVCLDSARPKPNPFFLPALTNGSNSLARMDGRIPGPVSANSISTDSPSTFSAMWIEPPFGIASSALPIRFRNTRSM